ncbi:MAG: inorganic diphosphatase [Firmicutes bacterium]|nr:inorganic diphosphatase [Bacillota bacterium]
MNIWHDIDSKRITPTDFIAVIEIAKGMNKKYELDKATGRLILDRILYGSSHYPQNYGFIPLTYAEDNDPLDVLILSSESIDPYTLVRCFPIGALNMTDNGEIDTKIIAIPFKDPYYNSYKTLDDLPPHLKGVIDNFFSTYKMLEGLSTAVHEFISLAEAEAIIAKSIKAYNEYFKRG